MADIDQVTQRERFKHQKELIWAITLEVDRILAILKINLAKN